MEIFSGTAGGSHLYSYIVVLIGGYRFSVLITDEDPDRLMVAEALEALAQSIRDAPEAEND